MNLDWIKQRDKQFWLLHTGGWAVWLVTFLAIDFYRGHVGIEPLLILLASGLAGMLFTLALRYAYRAIWESSPLLKLVVMVGGCFVLSMAWTAVQYFWIFEPYFPELMVDKEEKVSFGRHVAGNLGYSFFLFICWSVLYFGIKYFQLLQQEQQRTLVAIAAANEAQLRMLRYQLNPHFLFNTLNAVNTLIMAGDNESANQMVSRFSRFLRYSLYKNPLDRVDFEHELGALELYLEIEKVRFEERLRVVIECDDNARKALVPSLLLQPLVENAIKCAVAEREEGGTITIAARVFGGDLLIEFTDDGPGMVIDEESLAETRGIGLGTIRDRLQQLYGERYACRLGRASPHGLKVSMRIPHEVE